MTEQRRDSPSEELTTPASETEVSPEIRIDKKTLVFIVGLAGSGKSTFAIEHFPVDAIVNTDRLRQELSNNPGNQLVSDRAFEIAKKIVQKRLQGGEIAVVDAQNLTENNRAQFYQAAESAGAQVTAIFLNIGPEEVMARDRERTKAVGDDYIWSRRGLFDAALRSLKASKRVHAVHDLTAEEINRVEVKLPPDDQESLAADKELRREAGVAEALITAAETGLIRRELKEGAPTFTIDAGSVLLVETETSKRSKEFLDNNFLAHQVVDVESVAKRLKTSLDDKAVADVAELIVRQRTRLNLTTVVKYPPGYAYLDGIKRLIEAESAKREIEIPMPTLTAPELDQYEQVEVGRDAPDDAPLFIVGDVQGCYKSMRELTRRIWQENLEKRKEENSKPERKIVFVGDMGDRGPYDAEAVIYISALVRSGRAMLVKGNHDENLLAGLKGKDAGSAETRETVRLLKERLTPKSIQKIIEMIEAAPLYAEWKNLVVAHAALPRVPRRAEKMEPSEARTITHGSKAGFMGGRVEVWKLKNVVAKDPNILVVGGHTHEQKPVLEFVAGTAITDVDVEARGKLHGLYYPELQWATADEPEVLKMQDILNGTELPTGERLLKFIEFARQQSMLDVKYGEGEYAGLILASYSNITELSNLWERYPVLRNFRGIILDRAGNLVARPFKKSHKAGAEIPLNKLNMVPEKVFEKANGSLAIVYFWNGKWRVSTKFSFENEDYTKPAAAMLAGMDMNALDQTKTHLFEIILPNDSHIVDYGGRQELIMLNSIATASGGADSWERVAETAAALGTRTAADMTDRFEGMTIAQIYEYAQGPGNLPNLEGLIAIYRDKNGNEVLLKVKAREYDDKKFVRDVLDWDTILEAVDPATVDVAPEKFEELLKYNFDNEFARAALRTRLDWVRSEYEAVAAGAREFLFSPLTKAQEVYAAAKDSGADDKKAVDQALRSAVPVLVALLKESKGEASKGDMNAFMGFLRSLVSGKDRPEETLAAYALNRVRDRIAAETKKRGKNSFWLVPA